MAITVRRTTADDLEALRANERLPEERLADASFAEQQAGSVIYASAWEGNTPFGTAALDLSGGALCPQMRNMWVYPQARRRGAGRALSEFLADEAAAAGFSEIFLAVDPNNEKAIPLYLGLGYSPTGDHLFVDDPDVRQVSDPSLVSDYWSIYRKSLAVR